MNQPKDAQYEWLAANNGKIGPLLYKQHRYYKFENDAWYSWSVMFDQWRKSLNSDFWFTEQIIQGYFVKIKDLPTLEELAEHFKDWQGQEVSGKL